MICRIIRGEAVLEPSTELEMSIEAVWAQREVLWGQRQTWPGERVQRQ